MKTLKNRRGLDLLSQRAVSGLVEAEQEELARLLANEGLVEDDSVDLAAAAIDLAANPPTTEALPRSLAERLEREGRRFLAEPRAAPVRSAVPVRPQASTTAAGVQVVMMPSPAAAPRFDWTRYGGWIAAAAVVCLFVGQKVLERPAAGSSPSYLGAAHDENAPSRTLLGMPAGSSAGQAAATLSWSDATSSGELRVRGLPSGRYELWLEDGGRVGRPLAAGAFVATEGAEAVAPVRPAIAPHRPLRVAVTGETTGAALVPVITFTLTP